MTDKTQTISTALAGLRMVRGGRTLTAGLTLATALLAGCGLLPTTAYERPPLGVATHWASEGAMSSVDGAATTTEDATTREGAIPEAGTWWHAFGDAQLNDLVDQVLAKNTKLETARQRLALASIHFDKSQSARGPSLTGNARHDIVSSRSEPRSSSGLLSLTQIVDLWGVQSSKSKAAEFRVKAETLKREDTRNTLIGETGALYWEVAKLNQKHDLQHQFLENAKRKAALTLSRFEAGGEDQQALLRDEQAVIDAQIELETFDQARQSARISLGVLLGQPNNPPLLDHAVLPASSALPNIDAGLPADLLARRPDVQAAEWELRANLAGVDSARASLYPSLTLTGSMGSASGALIDLMTRPISTLAGSIALPFLDWNNRRHDIAQAKLEQEMAATTFTQTLYQALGEVEEGLKQRARYRAQDARLTLKLAMAREEERIARVRLDVGKTDLTPWIDQQEQRRRAEIALLDNRFEEVKNLMTLYKALGGGTV